LKSHSYIAASGTEAAGDILVSHNNNNKEQNIPASDSCASQGQTSQVTGATVLENNTSGQATDDVRRHHDSDTNFVGEKYSHPSSGAGNSEQATASGDTASQGSAATANCSDTGPVSQSSGSATVDSGSTSSSPSGSGGQTSSISGTDEGSSTGQIATPSLAPEPSIPVLGLAAASDSGVQGDDLTNVATSTLTGTGSGGETVTLIDGTTPIGTTTVANDGSWSIVSGMLADGTHNLTATEADSSGNVSAPSLPLALTIDTAAPSVPSNLALDPASDSGASGDDRTNLPSPVITGTAEIGTTVTLYDKGTAIGTGTADPTTGTFSISPSSPLDEGANSVIATSTDAAGNSASSGFTVTLDTTPPVVTDALGTDGVTVMGGGDPNTAVTISEDGKVLGTADGDSTGAWSFDTVGLAPGAHSLVATETDAAGNAGSAAPLGVTVSDPRFALTDTATSASSLLHGSDYPGPVNYVQATYDYTGTDSSVIGALVNDVFIHAGAGENAEAAKGGNNVLAGGNGSSWLVGASGQDGGTDTFFLSASGGQQAWDTLVNFHVGDMLTLWDFNSASGSTNSIGNQGASGAQGETLSVDFGDGSGATTLVTFAGLSSSAQFSTATGSSGGHDYAMLTRTS
jgi:hypothetical protein